MAATRAFVERVFEVGSGKRASKWALRIFQPTREKGGAYGCTYTLYEGRTCVRTMRVFGVDAVQSLILALGLVDIELDHHGSHRIAGWQRQDLRRVREALVTSRRRQ